MALAAVSSGTATVRYTVSDSGLAGCSLRIDGGGVAHLRYLNVGTCEILAYVDATPVLASAAATHTFTIIDVAQVMSWSPSTTSFAESDSPYTIPAARSSGMGALVYTVSPESSAVCALSGSNQISMNNVGNCTISASATEVRDSLDSSKILYAASTIPATYSFVVTASTVNTLSNISLGSIPFIEGAFSSTLEDYHADLKAGQSATLTLTLAERHESITALTLIDDHLDTTVLAYTPGMTLPLSTGSNSLSIQVASHSGSVKTYIIVLHLYPAQQITWTPIASVMESRAAVNIGKATALGGVDFHYSVKGSSTATCDISNASSPVATFTGAGDCIVQVTAEISNQYNLATTEQTITVLPSNDATLSSISLSDGFVSSTLSDTEINYISMPNGRATFNLDGFTVNGIGATVQFNNVGLPILSKTGITLDPNDQATQFLLTVTAHDGTRKVYTFRGTRALHINWNLTTAIYERVLGGMTLADFFGSLPQVSSSAATLTTSVIDGDGTVCSYAGGTFTTLFPGTCVLQVTASSVAGLTDADPLIETITIIPSSVTGLSVLTPRGALAGVGASPDIYTYANVDVIPGEGVGLRYSAKSGLEEVTVQINGVNYNCAENCMFEDELTDGVNIVTITTRSDFEVVHDLSSYSPQYSFTITKWKLQEFTTTWLHSVVQGFSTSLFPINGVYIEANRRYSIPSGDARVCTLNNAQLGSIFFGGVGTCHITVNSASSGFYRAAEPVTYEISVTADPTIGLRGSVTSNGVSIDVLPEIDTYNVTPSGPNDTVTVALRNIGYATTPPTYTLNGVTLPLPDNSTFALIPGQLNLLAVQAFNDAGEFIFYEFNFLLPSIPVDPVPSPTPSPIPDFLKAPHDSPAETSTAVVAEPAAPVVTPIVIAPEPKPIDKVAQPQVVAHFSSAAMWVKQRVSLIINPEQSSVALVIASATPGICALTTAGLIYASHAGRCVISVVNPTDATHVASTTTFTIKVIAPSLKVKSLLKPLHGKQIAITAGPIYKKKTIRIFSLPVGAKRSILLGTIKLNGQGVGLLVTPTLKSSKISLVYSHRTIASIKVK